mmetsp:Transcript_20681/g.39239  ORF Transcript_20681/g.39239 Transcript_20681/m.39239 type:complete len:216 (+) Transcript_20681:453-1100(+)
MLLLLLLFQEPRLVTPCTASITQTRRRGTSSSSALLEGGLAGHGVARMVRKAGRVGDDGGFFVAFVILVVVDVVVAVVGSDIVRGAVVVHVVVDVIIVRVLVAVFLVRDVIVNAIIQPAPFSLSCRRRRARSSVSVIPFAFSVSFPPRRRFNAGATPADSPGRLHGRQSAHAERTRTQNHLPFSRATLFPLQLNDGMDGTAAFVVDGGRGRHDRR